MAMCNGKWWRRHGDTWSDSHTRSIREVIYRLWEGTRRLSLRHIMCEKIPFWLRFFHPNTLITAQFIQNCEERRQTHLGKTIVYIRTNYARRKNLYMFERSDWKPGERDNLRDFLRFRDGPYSSSIIVAQSQKRPHGIWLLHLSLIHIWRCRRRG